MVPAVDVVRLVVSIAGKMLGKKARRGAPMFGMAWNLDEDALFHGGKTKEEV